MKIARILLQLAGLLVASIAAAKGPVYTAPMNKTFTFTSAPAGAKVYYQGRLVCASTPGTATITCKGVITPTGKKDMPAAIQRAAYNSRLTFTFVKDGYRPQDISIEPTITQLRGNNFQFDWQSSVICELEPLRNAAPSAPAPAPAPKSPSTRDTSIPKGEAGKVVNRDNPGSTSLEQTVIRWYFESQPQGARIFWRVISSVPSEVKNTNELWLGNTPFEETRSFNILGLTYENSRDVQIEIKVRRKGYLDQTKRFNVRQAVDQQEISSFFDLIKDEE